MTNSSSHRYILERFEDNGWAVLEVDANRSFPVPRAWLPKGVREGDALQARFEGGVEESELHFSIDPVATEELKSSLAEMEEKGRVPKAPPGDLEI
jgi:hypothetical protein